MTKFSNNILTGVLPLSTTPLALMLQNVSSSFTFITRDENPKALIICGKKILQFNKYRFQDFRQASKSSDKLFSGGAMAPLPPPPGHGATVLIDIGMITDNIFLSINRKFVDSLYYSARDISKSLPIGR